MEVFVDRPSANQPLQIALVLEDLLAPLTPLDNTKGKTDDPEHKEAPTTRPKPGSASTTVAVSPAAINLGVGRDSVRGDSRRAEDGRDARDGDCGEGAAGANGAG